MATVVELNGSGLLECNPERWRGQRIFHVTPYSAVEDFCAGMLGHTDIGSGDQVVHTPPVAFAPGSRLFAVGCRAEGLGSPSVAADGTVSYSGGARVWVDYSTLPYETDAPAHPTPDDPAMAAFVTEELRVASEVVTLPKQRFHWASDQVPLAADDRPPSRLIPKAEWVFTRHRVPELPRATLFHNLGKVNAFAMGQAASETLLFTGAEARREVGGRSDPAWRITLTFLYNPETHNRFFRGHQGGWDRVERQEDGEPVYELADLTVLVPELL